MNAQSEQSKIKKSKLLNTNQNKILLSIQIENFFNKSNLNSIELSYNKKVLDMKNLFYSFHHLYNSLNQYKSITFLTFSTTDI